MAVGSSEGETVAVTIFQVNTRTSVPSVSFHLSPALGRTLKLYVLALVATILPSTNSQLLPAKSIPESSLPVYAWSSLTVGATAGIKSLMMTTPLPPAAPGA